MKPLNPADYRTYNSGDVVTIRSWDDMAAEFGTNPYGTAIKISPPFLISMKHFCGKTFEIDFTLLYSSLSGFQRCVLKGVKGCTFSAPMFEQSKFQSIPPSSISFDSLLQGGV